MADYGLDDLESITRRDMSVSVHRHVQAGSGAHPGSYLVAVVYSGITVAEA